MQFRAVYREYFAIIWRALRRFGVAERDASDAAQEVFMIAYRQWGEFEGRSSMRTWLFGIAFRVAAGRRRRAPARLEVLGEDALARADVGHEEPEAILQRHDLLRLLDAGLSSLPLEQRAVFILFELEELSGEEIAAALNVPLGTVRSRLRLARAQFSRAIQALSPDTADATLRAGVSNHD